MCGCVHDDDSIRAYTYIKVENINNNDNEY